MTLFFSSELYNTAFHFTVYLMTPSEAHVSMQRLMLGHLMNDDLDKMLKETVWPNF
jgi:hypothetical protein